MTSALPKVIPFDRTKYGRDLLVDACDIPTLRNFITGPAPHRLRFYEIAMLTGGKGCLDIDGAPVHVKARTLCLTRPGEVRRWRLDAPVRGDVVFFEAAFLNEFFGDAGFVESLPLFASPHAARSCRVDARTFTRLAAIAAGMKAELADLRADSAHLLRANLYRLLIEVQREWGTAAQVAPARHAIVHRRFVRLLESHFRDLRRVGDYATRLDITSAHLNDCVQRATGATAGSAIRERLLLEACRLLLHTDLPASAIAADLRFADASYFNRFFRRMTGGTPSGYRQRRKVPGKPRSVS